jgi:hypothetical protein
MSAAGETALVSVILFGSAATGGFAGNVSDVDAPSPATRGARSNG